MLRKALLLTAVLATFSASSYANTITSDACMPGVRDFSVTADSVVGCLAVGQGNINGNNQGDAALLASGWIFLDKSDDSGGAHNGWLSGPLTSGLSGTFSIAAQAYTLYDRIAIGFKSGEGKADPDWAIFELADNTLGGTWSISGKQELSHAILYGYGTPPTTQVPEPGSLALLGLGGLLALAARRRQRSRD